MHIRRSHRIAGLAFAAATGSAALLACYADDNPDLTGAPDAASGTDAGAAVEAGSGLDADATSPEAATSDSGGAVDSGLDAAADGAADASAPPMFALVHAAPDVPAVRFCFGVQPTGAIGGVAAKPALAGGLPFGAGGALTVPASQAALLAATNLYIWAIPAASIEAAADGGADGGLGSSDCGFATGLAGSMLFDMIPAGTFQFGRSYIIAMVGCQQPDVDGGAAICGSSATDGGTVAFPSGALLGSVRLEIISVDNATAVPKDAIGAQFLHLSPSLQAVVPGGVVPGITSPADGGDSEAGSDAAAATYDYADLTSTAVSYNAVYSGPPGSTLAVPAQTFVGTAAASADLETAGIGLRTASLAVAAPALASIPLPSVALATLGLVDGGNPTAADLFTTGRSYTFIAVGNVGETPGTTTTFFRVIALPTVH